MVGLPAAPISAAPPPKKPINPDADYMGSSLAGHEPTAVARGLSLNAVAPTGVPGIDVSHWQGNMDWNGVAAGGTKWTYIKATEGTTFIDDHFAANASGSYNAGLLRGAYHFALPDVSPPAQQADFFVAHGANWTPDGRTLPPVLDIEYNKYGDTCYGLNPGQMVSWVEGFENRMHDLTGRWPVIYTTRGWWRLCTGNNPGFGLRSPLWIAGYHGDPNTLANGWASHTMWQYASDPIDRDVYSGDLNELNALATGSEPDAINAHYNRLGAAAYLGSPTGSRYDIGGGRAQDYANGTIYFTQGSGAWSLRGQILAFYRQQGGPAGFLGFPGFDETVPPDGVGRFSHFQGGSVYWSPATNAHVVLGAIRDTWASLGWEQFLGYPLTDEQGTSDGVGRMSSFQRGVIYFTPATGAHEVYGSIRDIWTALGSERSYLAYPTTGELGTPDGVGRASFFQRGAIYWTNATGAHEVQGAIYNTWSGLGYQASYLGYPVTGEANTPDNAGRFNNFQRGAVYWTNVTGAHEVQGSIYDTWTGLGSERSYLAYPTTGELGTPDGVGRASFFQRGAVYWTNATGAHEVQGAIYNTWSGLGYQASYLAYPTTGELGTPDGVGRASFFQRGAIYWTNATGAHEVQGSIYNTWASLGYQTSALGYPTSGEFDVAGGRRSNFEHGFITWSAVNGAVTVSYT
ncbi:MAG: GH25 family lysozyme [Labedaea sp.]